MKREPTINNTPLKQYGVYVLSYEIGPCEREGGIFVPASLMAMRTKRNFGSREISLEVDIYPTESKSSMQAMSEFVEMLNNTEIVIDLNDGFLYECIFDSEDTSQDNGLDIRTVVLKFLGNRTGETIEFDCNLSGEGDFTKTIECDTHLNANPIFIIATLGCTQLSINDITIKNIKPNGEIHLDSKNKKIVEILNDASYNKFLDTNISEFPSFVKGENKLKFVHDGSVNITVSYTPLYL